MLRHWYATELIRLNTNPEIVRRQLRHKNIETTMKIYVQINSQELEKAVIQRPSNRPNKEPDIERKLRLVK
jgi:integrase